MSMKAFSRIIRACGVANSRQFLGRHVPRRSMYIKQDKRASTKDELGILVFGIGALTTATVLAVNQGAFSINMSPAEIAKMKESEE